MTFRQPPVPPRSITFALWPDGHGVFRDVGGKSPRYSFEFNVSPQEAERFASEAFEALLRPADGGGWEFCGTPWATAARRGDEVVALSAEAVLLDSALIRPQFARPNLTGPTARTPCWMRTPLTNP